MNRIILSLGLLALGILVCNGQEAGYQGSFSDEGAFDSNEAHIPVVEEEVCAGPWERFHGFLFRRYAGSVEMESKTPYPKWYHGRYTYLPWKPDWVHTPANEIRESQYRHHLRGEGHEKAHVQPPSAWIPPAERITPVPPPVAVPSIPENLQEVEVLPAR